MTNFLRFNQLGEKSNSAKRRVQKRRFLKAFLLAFLWTFTSASFAAPSPPDVKPAPPTVSINTDSHTLHFRRLASLALPSLPSYFLCYNGVIDSGKISSLTRQNGGIVASNVSCSTVTPGSDDSEHLTDAENSKLLVKPIPAGTRLAIVLMLKTTDFFDCDSISTASMTITGTAVTSPDPTPVHTLEYKALTIKPPTEITNCAAELMTSLKGDQSYSINLSLPVSGQEKKMTTVLPPVHTIYRFGVSTGVTVSSVLSKNFGYSKTSTATNYDVITTSSVPVVDPVAFLTYYPAGFDAESKAKPDWGIVFGLSEKSPTSNFYLGGSFEPIRKFAIVFGVNTAKVARVDPDSYNPPGSGHYTPTTVDKYKIGVFVGVNINISSFLTAALFKGS